MNIMVFHMNIILYSGFVTLCCAVMNIFVRYEYLIIDGEMNQFMLSCKEVQVVVNQ